MSTFDLKGSRLSRQNISEKKLFGVDSHGRKRKIIDRKVMKDQEFREKMKMSFQSELTKRAISGASIMSNLQPKLKYSRTSLGMKTNPLDDTPPEEKDTKDNFLKKLSQQTLKDVDFENVVIGQLCHIDINENDISLILRTLERDVEFLRSQGLMDYSMLLGIEKVVDNAILINVDSYNVQDHPTHKPVTGMNLNNMSRILDNSIMNSTQDNVIVK